MNSFSHKSSSVLRLLLQMTFFMFDVFKDSHHGIKLRLIKDKTHIHRSLNFITRT